MIPYLNRVDVVRPCRIDFGFEIPRAGVDLAKGCFDLAAGIENRRRVAFLSENRLPSLEQ